MNIASRRFWVKAGLGLVLALIAIQFVPYGRNRVNPPIGAEPIWDSPETRALARRACFDCHSNETEWPAYARVAPVSWLVHHDVVEGRAVLNFSEWDRPQGEAGDIVEAVQEGSMPPLQYKPLHAGARLSDAQRSELVRGLQRTLAADPPPAGG
jgi:mono/diheme cytochrome c family protein